MYARHIIIIVMVIYTYARALAFLIDTQRFQCPVGFPPRNGRASLYRLGAIHTHTL